MAGNTVRESYSISRENDSWVKQRKQETRLPESHFINRGLDIQREVEKIDFGKLALGPVFYSFIGCLFFAFGMTFSESFSLPILVVIMAASIATIMVSWAAVVRIIRLWSKQKQPKKAQTVGEP